MISHKKRRGLSSGPLSFEAKSLCLCPLLASVGGPRSSLAARVPTGGARAQPRTWKGPPVREASLE
eukprot:4861382-Pyramimonas_sp.AAC.1